MPLILITPYMQRDIHRTFTRSAISNSLCQQREAAARMLNIRLTTSHLIPTPNTWTASNVQMMCLSHPVWPTSRFCVTSTGAITCDVAGAGDVTVCVTWRHWRGWRHCISTDASAGLPFSVLTTADDGSPAGLRKGALRICLGAATAEHSTENVRTEGKWKVFDVKNVKDSFVSTRHKVTGCWDM